MDDLEIYKKATQLLSMGEDVALVTVISTTGSTPGKVGYKMLVWGKKGQAFGTVGGGLVEAEIINAAKDMLPKIQNQVFRFNFDGTRDDERGICGGSVELLIETFGKKTLPLFKKVLRVTEKGGVGALVSTISHKKPPKKIFLQNIGQVNSATYIDCPPEIIESMKRVVDKEQSERMTLENGVEIFIEPVFEQPMVFIFGAGHLSYHISKYAKPLNFQVTVCDDRVEFANRQRFPDANNIIVETFEAVFDRININKNSYIVIVTRGHRCDEIVLERAVKTDARYIGMIGSKKKTLTILKRLREKGISQELLRRVYSPIGISIGAITPQEIALSIVCELVKIRRLGDTSETDHMTIALSTGLQ